MFCTVFVDRNYRMYTVTHWYDLTTDGLPKRYAYGLLTDNLPNRYVSGIAALHNYLELDTTYPDVDVDSMVVVTADHVCYVQL